MKLLELVWLLKFSVLWLNVHELWISVYALFIRFLDSLLVRWWTNPLMWEIFIRFISVFGRRTTRRPEADIGLGIACILLCCERYGFTLLYDVRKGLYFGLLMLSSLLVLVRFFSLKEFSHFPRGFLALWHPRWGPFGGVTNLQVLTVRNSIYSHFANETENWD